MTLDHSCSLTMTSRSYIASLSQDAQSCHVQKVFGDKLNDEEKLQVLEALMSTCQQKTSPQFPDLDANDLEPGRYDCNVCGKKNKSSSQYYGHLKKHKNDNFQWTCSQCPEGTSIFQSLSLLSKHKKSNHIELGNDKLLNVEFGETSVRETHQNKKRFAQSQFACQLCDKNFNKRSDLKVHLASHLSLKGCVCEVCGRSFSHMSNLIRHSYVHTGFKPYPCKVCGKRFTQVTSLNQHSISHHSNQRNPCPAVPEKCDKLFRTPAIAKQHAYRVHPDVQWENFDPKNLDKKRKRKYYCRHCGETFLSTNELKSHFTQHYKNEVRICKITCIKENLDMIAETGPDSVIEIKLLDSFENEVNNSSTNKLIEDYGDHVSKNLSSDQKDLPLKLNEVNAEIISEGLFSTSGNSNLSSLDDLAPPKDIGTEIINPSGMKISHDNRSGLEPELGTQKLINWTAKRIDDLSNFDLANVAVVGKSSEEAIHGHLESNKRNVEITVSPEHCQANLETKLVQRNECGNSPEILLKQCVNEESSSGMSHDVDMGLCPDSPNNQPMFDNDNDVRDQFGDVKCLESYQIPEPLILSFGDSYSALLKEIGIGEDDTNLEVSSDANDNTTKDEDRHNRPLLWDNYSTLLKENQQDIQGEEEDKNTQISNHDHLNELCVGIAGFPVGNISTAIAGQDFSLSQQESCVLKMKSSTNKDMIIYVAENDSSKIEDSLKQGIPEINFKEPHEIEGKSNSMIFSKNHKAASLLENITKNFNSKYCKTMKRETSNHVKKNLLLQPQCNKVPTNIVSSSTSEFSEVPCASESKMNKTDKICPECGKTFFKASNLTQHLGLHFPNLKTYECGICNISFSWKSSLNKHMNSHSESLRQYLCDLCGKQYKSFNQVQQHKRRDHESLRPHVCRTCDKTFFRKHDLLIHQRIHTNNKPFMCEICGKVFNHISHVKRHENIHLKNKPVRPQ